MSGLCNYQNNVKLKYLLTLWHIHRYLYFKMKTIISLRCSDGCDETIYNVWSRLSAIRQLELDKVSASQFAKCASQYPKVNVFEMSKKLNCSLLQIFLFTWGIEHSMGILNNRQLFTGNELLYVWSTKIFIFCNLTVNVWKKWRKEITLKCRRSTVASVLLYDLAVNSTIKYFLQNHDTLLFVFFLAIFW